MGCFGFARGGGEDFLLGGVIGVSVRGLGGVLIWVNGVMVCGFMCFGGGLGLEGGGGEVFLWGGVMGGGVGGWGGVLIWVNGVMGVWE